MLPSFRTIAATFLCGFIFVFAGLQVAATLNSKNMALPVTAAYAAPSPVTAAADWRSIPAAVPVLYDLRFVANAAAPTPASLWPQQIDRLAPIPVPAVAREVVPEPASTPVAADVTPIEASDIVATIPAASPSTQSINSPLPAELPHFPGTSTKLKTQPATIAAIETPLTRSDDPVAETPAMPQADTVAAASSETAKPDDTAIPPSPPPAAVEVASLASTALPAETEALDFQASTPVTVMIVLPKPRPAGEVLQSKRRTATRKRATNTQWTEQRDPFNNGPFGAEFNNWQRQGR